MINLIVDICKIIFNFSIIIIFQPFFRFAVRERARKARLKRHEKREQLGDLSSLIDEISSRGTSIYSDDLNALNSPLKSLHQPTSSLHHQQQHYEPPQHHLSGTGNKKHCIAY